MSFCGVQLGNTPDNPRAADSGFFVRQVSDFWTSQAVDDARHDSPGGAPIERARLRFKNIQLRTSGPAQESCRDLLTSLMIAAAVGSVRPPAKVVGTPRASASTR
jgi:hypothetical protein